MARRENSEINAGSMADIAFLLLIFFLVTTTMDVDSGIARKLPEKTEDTPEVTIKEKNVLDITVNRNNQLLIEGTDFVQVSDIRKIAMDFIDNGGGVSAPKADGTPGTPCDYCQGAKDPASSDHPSKAIISLQSDRGTSYATYISVQNELVGAYTVLRNRYSNKKFGKEFDKLTNDQQKEIKINIYPQIISEAEPTK